MIPCDNVEIKHKVYGKGKMIEINCEIESDIRIFIRWLDDKSILAGWYNHDDPNLEFQQISD